MAVKVKERRGKYWVFINHNGRRKAQCIGTDKRAAQQVAKSIQARLVLGDLSLPKAEKPFEDYYQNWLDTYVANHCKVATQEKYRLALKKYLKRAFGRTDITRITRED